METFKGALAPYAHHGANITGRAVGTDSQIMGLRFSGHHFSPGLVLTGFIARDFAK